MREKIARTIYEKRNGNGRTPWRMQSGAHKVPYLSDAEAALDALMEPTKEMIEALNGKAQCIGLIEEGWEAAMQAAKDGE